MADSPVVNNGLQKLPDCNSLNAHTISVVICTHNRAEHLQAVLESMELATRAFVDWECLIVDNASTDNTAEIAEEFSKSLPVRYLLETKIGLSHARNTGVKASRGDVVLFVDDDVRVDRQWLVAYSRAFQRYLSAGYFGGRIKPYWPSGKPAWLIDDRLALLRGAICHFDQGSETRWFMAGEERPYGASFAVRRAVFERIGGFRSELGQNGVAVGRGEETDLLDRASAQGELGVYVGEALCLHLASMARLTPIGMLRYGYGKGKSDLIIHPKVPGSIGRALAFVARGLFQQLIRRRGDRFRQCLINAGMQMAMRRG